MAKTPYSSGKEIFMGVVVYDENRVFRKYNRDDYKEIISKSKALGISIPNYLAILTSPCTNCGNDKIVIDKVVQNTSKRFRLASKVQLYIFINCDQPKNSEKCNLEVEYSLACKIEVSKSQSIYTIPNKPFSYKGGDNDNVILCIMKNDTLWLSIMCEIKNNKLYSK